MKVVLCLRSSAAYENVVKSLSLSKKLNDITIAKENITTVELLKDFIDFYEADLYVLDAATNHVLEMKELLQEHDKKHIFVESIKEITSIMEQEFGIEIVEEKEILPQAVIQELPKNNYKPRIIEIEKEVIVSKFRAIPKKTILIGSLYSNAGSTIIATNLARAIAEREVDVTYIENPLAVPRMYDFLQVHTAYPMYLDAAHEIIKGNIPKQYRPFEYKDVRWVLNDPSKQRHTEVTFEQLTLLKQIADATITIYDISDHYNHPEVIKLAQIADEVILVAEANPIKNEYHFTNPNRGLNIVSMLENAEVDYKIFLTKTGIKGLDMSIIRDLLPTDAAYEMKYIPYEYLIEDLFHSKLYYDTSEDAKDFIETELEELIRDLLPSEIAKLSKKNPKSLMGRIFKRNN